jgi:hypothetical protein
MKYFLKEKVELGGDKEYKAYTQIHPIWNETFLPTHLKEYLNNYKGSLSGSYYTDVIMCLIGLDWVPVPKSKIIERP